MLAEHNNQNGHDDMLRIRQKHSKNNKKLGLTTFKLFNNQAKLKTDIYLACITLAFPILINKFYSKHSIISKFTTQNESNIKLIN